MRRGTAGLCVAGALVLSGLTYALPASAAEPPSTTIDITKLPRGEQLELAYVADAMVHDGRKRTPVGDEPVRAFTALDRRYVYQSVVDEADGLTEIRWASASGGSKVLAEAGEYFEPFTDGDTEFAWVRPERSDGEVWSHIQSAWPDGDLDTITSGPVERSPYHIVGGTHLGYLMDAEADVNATIDDGETQSYGFISIGATAGTEYAGDGSLIGLIERYDAQQRPCTTTYDVDALAFTTELWSSCRFTPIDYSPDGKWAVLVDSRTDGLGRSVLHVADARTGTRVRTFDVQLNQRLAWEPDGSLVLDAWKGNRMALVRCDLGTGTCERATKLARSAPEDYPAFLLPRM